MTTLSQSSREHSSHRGPRAGTILRRDTQCALLGACNLRSASGFRDYTLLVLFLETGLRPAEVCTLTCASLQNVTLLQVQGKAGRVRQVSLGLDAASTLWEYCHKHRHPIRPQEEALFLSDAGTPFDVQTLTATVRAVGERAGLGAVSITPHLLRRTVIARWWTIYRHAKKEQV